MYAVAILSVGAIAITKAAMLFFHLRITPHRSQRITCYALVALCTVWAVVVMTLVGTRCGNHTPETLYAKYCENYVSKSDSDNMAYALIAFEGKSMDRRRRHGLVFGSHHIRHTSVDSLGRQHSTKLQGSNPRRLRLASADPSRRSLSSIYLRPVGHHRTAFRTGASCPTFCLVKRRDQLRYHGSDHPNPRKLLQIDQHTLGSHGWPRCSAIRSGVAL